MKYVFLASFALLFLSACISKDCKVRNGQYDFTVPATLTPAQTSYRVGDTITISSTFSDQVFDAATGEVYSLEDFRFFPGTGIRKIDVSPAVDGMPDFTAIIDTTYNYFPAIYSGLQLLVGEYTYENNTYSLEFNLVPNEAGLYYMEQGIAPEISEGQEFPGRCKNARLLTGSMTLNDLAENNLNLLANSPDEHYNTWILEKPFERFYKFGGYVFEVVE